ncbi:Plasma membrane ATPase 3 [Camellia lanceoleosa]|uniref:Plasma membrane ATPase 3 n=1 Tax=Camellia lanceoleosa TaxID=1840588 RepID=A0ACC0HUL6_9ERIC|nr:Plasma membrane ATPase 3 [Camellia lanceoleosa]
MKETEIGTKGVTMDALKKESVDLGMEDIAIKEVVQNLKCNIEGDTSTTAEQRLTIFGHGSCRSGCEPVETICSKIHGVFQLSQKHKPEKEDGDIADDMARASARTNKGMTSRMKAIDELAVGGSWSNTSVVAETVACIGNSNEEGTCVAESLLTVKSLHQRSNHFAQKGVEDQLATNTLQKRVECNQDPQFSPLVGPALCEASIGCPQPKAKGTFRPSSSGSTSSRLTKGKRKGARREGIKQSLFAGRFSGFATRVGHKGAGSSTGFKRGIRARSLTIHSSPNQTSESIHTSSSKEILQEALETLQVGKTLGIDYKGQESKVVKKFILMEEQDKVRMAGVGAMCDSGLIAKVQVRIMIWFWFCNCCSGVCCLMVDCWWTDSMGCCLWLNGPTGLSTLCYGLLWLSLSLVWAAMLRLLSYDLWSGVAEMVVGGLVDFWLLLYSKGVWVTV